MDRRPPLPKESMQAVGGGNLGVITRPRSHSPPQELATGTTSTASTAAAGLILALDLGEYKTAACLYDGQDELVNKLHAAVHGLAALRTRDFRSVAVAYDWSRMAPRYDAAFAQIAQ